MKNENVTISAELLYKKFGHNLTYVTIEVDRAYNTTFYDMIKDHNGIVCMDGEECTVLKVDEHGTVTLLNDNGEQDNTFKLSKEEYAVGAFQGY